MSAEPQFRRADGAAIRIWREPRENKFLSEKLGRPIFDEAVMAEVITPGSAASIPVYELKRTFHDAAHIPEPALSANFAEYRQYVEHFENGEVTASMAGTPLSEWPEISVSLAATLKASGVFTVDALAALPDEKLSLVGPDGRAYRTKAQAFLDKATGSVEVTVLAAELERAKDEVKLRDEQIAALNAKIDALAAERSDVTPIDPFVIGDTPPAAPPATPGKKAAKATDAPIV